MVDACKERGAEIVFLTYPGGPFSKQEQRSVLKSVSEGGSAHVSDMHEVFMAIPASERRTLYAPDGHCNDLGYSVMGKRVAASLVQIWDR